MSSNIQGWMTEAELNWLGWAARRVESVAEIGCWKGRSTHALLSACPGPVYAVDHWQGSTTERSGPHREAAERDIFQDFMGNVGHFANLRVRKGHSTEVAPTLPMVDMAFIDAGHEYSEVFADIKAWAPKCLRFIAGHDYQHPGVRQAVDEIFGKRVMHGPDSIWFVPNPDPPRVMIATPAYDMSVTTPYMISVLELLSANDNYRVAFDWRTVSDSLIGRARIRLMSEFLASDRTHLLFIDSDLKFAPSAVFDLLRWSKPLVGGVYPCKTLNNRWPCNFMGEDGGDATVCPETGCVLAKDLPTGFMMIRRDCIEAMAEAYPERQCKIEQDYHLNQHCYNFFDQPIDDGVLLSEDFAFCRHYQRIGGEAWIDPQIEMTHYGTHGFNQGAIAVTLTKQQREMVAA